MTHKLKPGKTRYWIPNMKKEVIVQISNAFGINVMADIQIDPVTHDILIEFAEPLEATHQVVVINQYDFQM